MKKLIFGICLLIFSIASYAQENPHDKWDANYIEINLVDLLTAEKAYADSIKADPNSVQYYLREKGYRFEGQFTGKWRSIPSERIMVMKQVHKLFQGESELFDTIQKEVEIAFGNQTLWMPIQPILEKTI